MPIGDWVLKTWQNGIDVTNATNMNRIDTKINELDNAIQVIIKDTNESVNNSTTLQNDNALVASLEANGIFEVECLLLVNGPTSADMKTAWTTTGGAAILSGRFCIGASASNTGNNQAVNYMSLPGQTALSDQSAYCAGDATNKTIIYEKFIMQTTTAGTLQLQWAQIGAVATNTTVYAGSYMKITKLKNI